MSNSAKVSVILIVYNGARTLPLALSSLLIQTFQNWECVIVDDGSTDDTPEILSGLTDSRFLSLRSDIRLGRGAARQMAMESARAPYVCSLDADDFFYANKLERQVAILDSNLSLMATVGRMFYFTDPLAPLGIPVGYFPPGTRTIAERPSHLRIPFGPTMFRRNRQVTYAPMPRSEDRQFYSDLLRGAEIHIENEPSYGCLWRMSHADIQLGLEQNLIIYRSARKRAFAWGTLLVTYTQIKRWLYAFVQRIGMWTFLTRLKYRPGSPTQNQNFELLVRTLVLMTRDRGPRRQQAKTGMN